jgi:hypothetical protein
MTAGLPTRDAVIDDNRPLGEARDWLRERIDDGEACPCCGQFAKVYRRTINSGMAVLLLALYRAAQPGEWVKVPSLGGQGGDITKCRYWELIEPQPDLTRDDGSNRTGWWRLTYRGVEFILDRLAVPKYARVYDGRLLNLTGPPVTIRDALGARFNYDELMAGDTQHDR